MTEPPVTGISTAPLILIEGDFTLPKIEAQQAAFRAEHPDDYLLDVDYYRNQLMRGIEKIKNSSDILAGTGTCEQTGGETVDDDGNTTHLAVRITGVRNAQVLGGAITSYLSAWMLWAVAELRMDPTGDRRREGLQRLAELGLTEIKLEGYRTAELSHITLKIEDLESIARLRAESAAEQLKPKKGGIWAALKRLWGTFASE